MKQNRNSHIYIYIAFFDLKVPIWGQRLPELEGLGFRVYFLVLLPPLKIDVLPRAMVQVVAQENQIVATRIGDFVSLIGEIAVNCIVTLQGHPISNTTNI